MNMQELILNCRYSEREQTVAQIIESSFAAFLKKELKMLPNTYDERPLISGVTLCI